MKKMKLFKRLTACVLVLVLAVPFTAISQQAEYAMDVQGPGQVFRPEELDQMLAPIALYPDALLAQVLTSATYPLDIVAADRFIKINPGLRGEQLMDAARDKDWSPSVKAMLQFPDVLVMMSNQLDWTTKLGDAFLAQQRDVMESVQRLREKAYAQGKLASNAQEVITQDPQTQTIIIEQANPEVVYVPVYDPLDVYGVWWYPDYPPYYCYYPGYISGSFLVGIFVGTLWGWRSWGCDWRHHNVFINVNNFNNFARHNFSRSEPFLINRNAGRNIPWEHNPQHRRNAGYRDYWTAQRFGGAQVSNPVARPAAPVFRGREQARPSVPSPRITTQPTRSSPRGSSPRVGISSQTVVMPQARQVSRARESFSVFSGAGSGASERAASFRGRSSFHNARNSGSSLGVSAGRETGSQEGKESSHSESRGRRR